MPADFLMLAQSASDLVTWQERLLLPFTAHGLQLLCSVLVGGVLGLIGCFVVLRRMALIGDAISHAVLPGVVIAFLLVSTGVIGMFIGALVAGIATAIGINLVTRFSRAREDAAVGIVFTAMFAVGVILISRLPAGIHFDMKCFLFGDPLAIERADLISVGIIAPLVVAIIALLFHPLKLVSFDETLARTLGFNTTALHYVLMILLSATIVAALRSVGVIMAVAMLITPAAFAYQLTNRLWCMLVIASATGALAAGVGMFLAFLTNNPSGPMMVVVATALFVAAVLFAPERGVLPVWLRRRRVRDHMAEEDILRELAKAEESGGTTPDLAAALQPLAPGRIRDALGRLRRQGLLTGCLTQPTLSPTGRARALQMLRAHRLWEAYLAHEDVDQAVLHPEAHRLEHAHDVAEQLAESLGQPQTDPHGSPIPGPR